MKLIPDWNKSWTYYSQVAMGIAVAIQATWAAMPVDLREAVPDDMLPYITGTILVFGIVGRVVDQGSSDGNG